MLNTYKGSTTINKLLTYWFPKLAQVTAAWVKGSAVLLKGGLINGNRASGGGMLIAFKHSVSVFESGTVIFPFKAFLSSDR